MQWCAGSPQVVIPDADAKLIEWWPDRRLRLPRLLRKGFDSLVLLTVWSLSKEHNARVYERSAITVPTLCRIINDEVQLWKLSGAMFLLYHSEGCDICG